MNARTVRRLKLVAFAVVVFAAPAFGDPITFETWNQFAFSTAGTPATGCDPADPAGPFCIPSFGTPTDFLPAPPWTFTAPSIGASLTVTDSFAAGDRFQVFDFGVSLGLTSSPVGSADCGDDPVPCLADPNVSHGTFLLGSGPHSITIIPTSAPFGGGSGFLIAQAGVAEAAVPEPSTWMLLSGGLFTFVVMRRRSK